MTELSERLAAKDPQFHALLADILAELRSRLPDDATPADIERVLDEMELEQRERHERELADLPRHHGLTQEDINRIARPYALFALSIPVVAVIVAIVVAVTR